MTNISYESLLVTPMPGRFIELKGLNKYIRVSAATRVGSGPASDPQTRLVSKRRLSRNTSAAKTLEKKS